MVRVQFRPSKQVARDDGPVRIFPDKQRGFALASGIFLLVILAALGAFIVAVSTTQHIGSALDVQGARAYQAARAGMEWGLYRVLRDSGYANNTAATTSNQLSAASNCNAAPGTGTTTTISPLSASTLAGFTIVVTCTTYHDNINMGPWSYTIESTASVGTVGANYVERRVRVTF